MRSPIKNRLFTFLSTSYRAVGDALRTNPRHGSSARARLSWPGPKGDVTIRARLIDISRAGVALLTKEAPPVDARVRIRLVGLDSTPWVEAKVLGLDPMTRGRHRVRLQFHEPCPTFFLRAAVLGNPESAPAGQAETSVEGQWNEVPSGESTEGVLSEKAGREVESRASLTR